MDKYQIALEAAGGFYLRWVRGQELFERAERTKAQEDYRAAADELRAALKSEDAARDLTAAAQCRYQLGWALYRLGEFEAAAGTFREAVAGLQAGKDETAVQAAWMAFVAYASLAKTDPRFLSSATSMLEQVKRDFPEHERAKQADYHLSRLQSQIASPQETLARLEKVAPGTRQLSRCAATISACCGIACGGKVRRRSVKKPRRICSPRSNVIWPHRERP